MRWSAIDLRWPGNARGAGGAGGQVLREGAGDRVHRGGAEGHHPGRGAEAADAQGAVRGAILGGQMGVTL